jgi:glucosyl-dolichyl phosphate glucuronosyltransferase
VNKQVEISVIICTYNRQEYILDALESLRNQTLAQDKFEVIVVNNNSPDNTEALVKEYILLHQESNIFYQVEKQQGASYARNAGAGLAQSGLLVFMDDDAIAEPDYLENILKFYSANQDISGLGGRIIPRYIPSEPPWMSHFVSSLVGNFDYNKTVTEFKPGKYPLESNMVVKKEDFHLVGGFNTALPGVKGTLRIGGEGKDFFLKLQKAGKRIFYDPSIIVHHVVEVNKLTSEYMYRVASGIGRGERVRTKALGGFSFLKKILEYLFKLGGSVVLAIIYALRGKPKQAWPVIQFRIDALKGLLGY